MAISDWLSGELERWVAEGIISRAQADRIRARYATATPPESGRHETAASHAAEAAAPRGAEVWRHAPPAQDTEAVPPRRSTAVVVLSVLGAVFIAAGIVLFFAHNWTSIPRVAKLAIIGGALLAIYAAADQFLFSARRASPAVGTALLVSGGGVYGAAIFLIGQIYNLNSHWPNGLLAWWLGVLPLAYLFDSTALMWLTLIIGQSWYCAEFLAHSSEQVALGLILIVALFYWVVGELLRDAHPALAGPLRALGVLEGLSVLLLRTWPLWGSYRASRGAAALIVLAAAILALAGVCVARKAHLRMPRTELPAVAGMIILAGLFVFQPLGSGPWARVGFNLILLAAIAGVLSRGIRRGEPWMVNTAVTFIAFEAIARYIDAFWGYLARSAAFLISGILLLAGGWLLERQRRFWMRMMRRTSA